MAARLLGTTDVALLLGCSAERVRQLEREGKLSAERMMSGQRVCKAKDGERFAAEREQRKKEQAARAV